MIKTVEDVKKFIHEEIERYMEGSNTTDDAYIKDRFGYAANVLNTLLIKIEDREDEDDKQREV